MSPTLTPTDQAMLEAYLSEFVYSGTLQDLIESHRRLRQWHRESIDVANAKIEAAVNNRLAAVIDNKYVTWEELKSMTLIQIANRVADET